jgi:hypothetical protein
VVVKSSIPTIFTRRKRRGTPPADHAKRSIPLFQAESSDRLHYPFLIGGGHADKERQSYRESVSQKRHGEVVLAIVVSLKIVSERMHGVGALTYSDPLTFEIRHELIPLAVKIGEQIPIDSVTPTDIKTVEAV